MTLKLVKSPNQQQDRLTGSVHTGNDNVLRVAETNWSETEVKPINGNISNFSSLLSCNHMLRVTSLAPGSKCCTKKYIIGEEKVTFKLDTGVDVNRIPVKVIKKIRC